MRGGLEGREHQAPPVLALRQVGTDPTLPQEKTSKNTYAGQGPPHLIDTRVHTSIPKIFDAQELEISKMASLSWQSKNLHNHFLPFYWNIRK